MTALWNRLRITHRFVFVLGAFLLSLLTVSSIGLWGMSSARDSTKILREESITRSLLAGQSIELTQGNRMQVLLAFQHDPGGALSRIHDHPTKLHLDAIAANQAQSNKIWQQIEQGLTDPKERALLDAARAAQALWRVELAKAVDAVRANDFSVDTMAAFLAAGRNQGENLVKATSALRDYQVESGEAAYQAAERRYHLALWIFGGAALLLALPSLLLALALLGRLKNGFAKAGAAAESIAGSDLSHPVQHDGNDEIGELLQQMEHMRDNLSGVIGQVREGTGAIAIASAEVAAGTMDLSSRTEQQASALEETAAATEELSSTVQHNADNAAQADLLAGEARRIAQSGGDIVVQMVQTMAEIDRSAKRIVDIIGVIDSIAFQTNILALNAAVEAARAGEQGRGFAVVASEVRSLAQRSADAAREVQTLITDAVAKAESGNAQAAQAGAAMQDIVSGIQRVADIVDDISLSSREQATGLSQINDAVSHLDGMTQQNAALVEQSSAAADSLRQQARQLAAMAETFRLEDAPTLREAGSAPTLLRVGESAPLRPALANG